MLIGMTINTSGQSSASYVRQFVRFGKAIKRLFGHPLARTSGRGKDLNLYLGRKPVKVDQVVLMEKSAGQRVRKFVLQVWSGGDGKKSVMGYR